jgi:hypothetical protein
VGGSTISGNGTATQAINGGAVASFKNNQINENTAGDNPNLPPVPPS